MKFDRQLKLFSQQLQASKLKVDMTLPDNQSTSLGGQNAVTASAVETPATTIDVHLAKLAIRYEEGATNSIPDSINDKVTEQLVRESCAKWKEIVTNLLKAVSCLIREIVSDSVKEKLSEWQHTKIYDTIKEVLTDNVKKTMDAEGKRIFRLLECVQKKPTVTNDDYMTKKKDCLERLLVERYPRKSEDDADPPSVEWVNEKLASDQCGQIIDCVATIYTYHDILSDNFAGVTSTMLKAGVLAELVDEVPTALRATLNVLDTDHCAALLAEDGEREEERNALLAEKENLEQALSVVENLQDAE
jgi:hypothetical protein